MKDMTATNNDDRVDGVVRDAEKAFMKVFTTSLITIILCMISLVGLTWAWYDVNIVSATTVVSAANYNIEIDSVVQIKDESDNETEVLLTGNDGDYLLQSGCTYSVRLKGSGTATNGFAVIYLGNMVYNTESIRLEYQGEIIRPGTDISNFPKSAEYTFTVKIDKDSAVSLRVLGVWGSTTKTDITADELFVYPSERPGTAQGGG